MVETRDPALVESLKKSSMNTVDFYAYIYMYICARIYTYTCAYCMRYAHMYV